MSSLEKLLTNGGREAVGWGVIYLWLGIFRTTILDIIMLRTASTDPHMITEKGLPSVPVHHDRIILRHHAFHRVEP